MGAKSGALAVKGSRRRRGSGGGGADSGFRLGDSPGIGRA